MKDGTKSRIIKRITVNLEKCIGCRACEMACSGFHAVPKFSSTNPARSRIRVVVEDRKDIYIPIRAAGYTPSECESRNTYSIKDKNYPECGLCNASCPSRELFREPDSGLPLKCDMCESVPPLDEPMCVQVCRCGVLTYDEWEERRDDQVNREQMEIGLQSLVNRYGVEKVMERIEQFSRNVKR
ncbi:MAG: 4Fe-4S binding protein [Desulfocapsaceae bacterium]|nr:4Fe-4S binding protein [Desulfocapsaceae bacterium]